MKFSSASERFPIFIQTACSRTLYQQQKLQFTTFLRKLQSTTGGARASIDYGGGGGRSGNNGSSEDNFFLIPGATVATILMLGALHARRLYDDTKVKEAREKAIELEFKPDVKASFLRLLPLRAISRCWGILSGMEFPIWLRPHVYKAWARAFHSNLEEASLPLEEYASLRDFFVRRLKEGTRPIDPDPHSLISPVDGTVLRFGQLKASGDMIEQIKGYSYSASTLLGSSMLLTAAKNIEKENGGEVNASKKGPQGSWWRVSFAFPKLRGPEASCLMKGLFYCVIYLRPGDYHRIHSPVDWNVLTRRHFPGRLFPVNERATRTIRNLYVENERVVLEGRCQEGYMAMAAIGATNIGSIELFIEPELRTNQPLKKFWHSEPPRSRVYEPEGTGVILKKGDEVAAFNMGSTVVLVFQAPPSRSRVNKDSSSEFTFSVKRGDKIRMGEPLGRWHDVD